MAAPSASQLLLTSEHGPPHSPPHRPPHSPPHRPPHSPPHRPPHSPVHRPPHSPPHRPPHSPPHRPPHSPPHRPPHSPPHRPSTSRSLCDVCGRSMPLTKAGVFRVHGPLSNRCGGSGMSPSTPTAEDSLPVSVAFIASTQRSPLFVPCACIELSDR